MSSQPLVSVITIFLDAERFLAEAIDSVFAQTYPNWELLLCDDGSSDASPTIARAYAAEHAARVRYLEHPAHANRGMSATRNLGITHAHGTLFALLDADDVWEPQKLERQVRVLQEHPDVAMVFGPSLMWHGWTGNAADAARDEYRRVGARRNRVVKGRDVLRSVLSGRAESPGTCSWLIRAEAVRAVGGFEEGFRGMFEDQAFLSKLLLEHDVYIMRSSYDRYRQHPDSSCNVAIRSGEHHHELPAAARDNYHAWLDDYLREKNAGPGLRARVARERWFYRHSTAARLRYMLHENARRLLGRMVGFGFGLGRVVLPRRLRRSLWNAWSSRGRPVEESADSGLSAAGMSKRRLER